MTERGRSAGLIGAAILAAVALRAAHLPAAWMFGPLAVSALFAVRGWATLGLPNSAYIAAQAIIGTALGSGFSLQTLQVLPQHFGIFTFAVVVILGTSLLNGWMLARWTPLEAPTAFLGTMPGGAGAMASMSDSLGANTALVSAVQYVRLLVILGSLAIIGYFLHHHAAVSPVVVASLPRATISSPWEWMELTVLAAVGWLAGTRTKIPAGAFLVPTLLYFLVSSFGGASPGRWPWPILAVAYGIMGMRIGGRFHPSTLGLIRSVLLPVIGTTTLLLLASLGIAWVISWRMGLNFLSAYLAATPGGLDSVAAIAAEAHVDIAIVVAMHLVRLLCVLLVGPWLVRHSVAWVRGVEPS